jgi:Protein of unknown function (DUF3551)
MKLSQALLIAAFGGSGLMAIAPARAEMVFRYCMIGTPNMGRDCTFTTLQQCQATAAGGIGFCQENPAYTAQARQTIRPVPQR